MLLRRWTTQIDPTRTAEYEAFAADVSLPMFRAHPGLIAVLMSTDGVTATVQTIWENEAGIRNMEASPLYGETVRHIVSRGFLTGVQRVDLERLHLADWPHAQMRPSVQMVDANTFIHPEKT